MSTENPERREKRMLYIYECGCRGWGLLELDEFGDIDDETTERFEPCPIRQRLVRELEEVELEEAAAVVEVVSGPGGYSPRDPLPGNHQQHAAILRDPEYIQASKRMSDLLAWLEKHDNTPYEVHVVHEVGEDHVVHEVGEDPDDPRLKEDG
jgi:hypothetical protein